jgi:hypothetical protein
LALRLERHYNQSDDADRDHFHAAFKNARGIANKALEALASYCDGEPDVRERQPTNNHTSPLVGLRKVEGLPIDYAGEWRFNGDRDELKTLFNIAYKATRHIRKNDASDTVMSHAILAVRDACDACLTTAATGKTKGGGDELH